jgi:LPXTG-motif cell wall-anchored protein
LLKRGLSYALAVILTAGTFFGFGWTQPESAHAAMGDIVASGALQTKDIVYYGNYPQTDLGTEEPVTGTSGVDWVKSGSKYFKIEPIAWRVLENASGKLFLLSEKAIDCKPYNKNYENITWETCTARSWLNGYAAGENTDGENYSDAGTNFITNAFSAAEQAKIPSTLITNPNSIDYGTAGGNNTTDKIFYLKIADVNNVSYGFTNDNSRIAPATGYAAAMGATVSSGNAPWWLRSPGSNARSAALVYDTGDLFTSGYPVDNTGYAARPAFYLETSGVIFRETGTPDEYQASIPSTDATLSNLSVSAGTLSPVFASGTEEYGVEVPYSASSITLTAETTDANATVTGDVGAKSLNVGQNKFEITVTAEDGIATKIYTVIVTRAASTDATLSNLSVNPGTLSPAFSSATTSYNVEVPNTASSITLTATKADANATVSGDGVKSLSVGANKFEITVTAEDGTTQKIYTVTVTRAEPDKTANDDEDDDSDDDVDDDDEDSDAVGEDENNDSGDSDSGITSQPKTGDASMLLWFAAMLMSAAVLMLFVLIRIRRKARME